MENNVCSLNFGNRWLTQGHRRQRWRLAIQKSLLSQRWRLSDLLLFGRSAIVQPRAEQMAATGQPALPERKEDFCGDEVRPFQRRERSNERAWTAIRAIRPSLLSGTDRLK
jgi:hypothetical protein